MQLPLKIILKDGKYYEQYADETFELDDHSELIQYVGMPCIYRPKNRVCQAGATHCKYYDDALCKISEN